MPPPHPRRGSIMRHGWTTALLVLSSGVIVFGTPEDGAARDALPRYAQYARSACTPADTTEVGVAYYSLNLFTPASDVGRPRVAGTVRVSYPSSPFGLPLDREGRLVQRLAVELDPRWRSRHGRLVVWVAPPELQPVRRLGEVGEDGTVAGEVALNKYLVFVTEEPAGAAATDGWQGPVLLKGKSRSGRMQSMASHGMFEPEPC